MLEGIIFNPDMTHALVESILDSVYDGLKKSAVVRATGMSYTELNEFLETRGLAYTGSRISTKAIPELKKWYAGKMRRYVRNALALTLAPDNEEGLLFFQFCSRYLKHGHRAVKSWDDIDEARLLLDFVDACYAERDYAVSVVSKIDDLLDRIHRCYLFSLRLKKTPKHHFPATKIIISFILSNRYHIFSGDADSNMDATVHLAKTPLLLQFNQPWRESRPVFAS